MHKFAIPDSIKERVIARQGVLHPYDVFDGAKTALVVVDMQNYFVAPNHPGAIAMARQIVPNINRLARGVRAIGGKVVWIQTSAKGGMRTWANHHNHMLTAERRSYRLANLAEESEGFRLWPELQAMDDDLYVIKYKYSAMFEDSSSLGAVLRKHGIDTLLITGTATNVCCETTARDAMVLDFKVVMVSDGLAAVTDQEHAASLHSFILYFGDVLTTDEVLGRLVPAAMQSTG